MRNNQRILIAAVAALALCTSLAPAAAQDLVLQPGSKLWLKGSSTVHDYSSQASKLEVTFQSDASRWPAGASGAEAIAGLIRAGGVAGMIVTVPVTSLQSGKDGLDRNMYKALKAEKSPVIRFHMVTYQVAEGASPAELKIDARGTLSIAGVEREVPMTAVAVREGDGMRLRGNVPLQMTQFGIKPPTMMMGAVRTSDHVVVSFDLVVGGAGAMSRAE